MKLGTRSVWVTCCSAMLFYVGSAVAESRSDVVGNGAGVTTYSGQGVAELFIAPSLPAGWTVVASDGGAGVLTFPVDGSFDVQSNRSSFGIAGGQFVLEGPALTIIRPNGDGIELNDLAVTYSQSGRGLVRFGSTFGPEYGRPGLVLGTTSTQFTPDGGLVLESPLQIAVQMATALGIDATADNTLGFVRVALDELFVDSSGGDRITDGAEVGNGAVAGGIGPDVFTLEIGSSLSKYGTVGGITGYAMATTSCNMGDEQAEWFSGQNRHPLIAQNMYRINQAGDFEQIGMSWLKHAWCAADFFACAGGGSPNGTCNWMTIGIADVYSAGLNATQSDLGPRSEVNAASGDYPYPYNLNWNQGGNATFKRLQIHEADLDPAQNPGAIYIGEGHYVTTDEADNDTDTQYNNATWRDVIVGGYSNGWSLGFSGSSHTLESAIEAWPQKVAGVSLETIMVPEDNGAPEGKMILGYRVSQNPDESWHYSYALYNMNSDRAARAFSVLIPDSDIEITNVEFHDVDYHSGEPYAGTDWIATETATECKWETVQTFAQNQNANALRWGTTYSFRFDSPNPPYRTGATIELFKPLPGGPNAIELSVEGPAVDCNNNNIADPQDIGNDPGLDSDGNGLIDACEALVATFAASGWQQLSVEFVGVGEPFAMNVAGDLEDPNVSCVNGWIQADGSLGASPVYQTATEWGSPLYINDGDIIPESTYMISFDPAILPDQSDTTSIWADIDGNGVRNLSDVLDVILGFQDPQGSPYTVEQLDVDPICGGDGVANLADAQRVVLAWQGSSNWFGTCPLPCGP